ncbi:MAG: Re/Si-specific NAD(P)(+) transhydrogenase subunit alpha [Leptospiraceae bacterium]|nr:Re/Si-specific NAD(P)(+) transhydrogenase subunit alpha [Leptospiraceae bacterium]MDW8305699.1 Re/Si-specific NAD(P)(+) transhydrogenase subunit alpha [Leptospiraceae bacterium]
MVIGVVKETRPNERRVALVPESVKRLKERGLRILVEKGAGLLSYYSDEEYQEAGAELFSSFAEVVLQSDILVKVRPPSPSEAEKLRERSHLIALLEPFSQKELVAIYQKKNISAYALEFIPRTTLAQSMDVLSSMAAIAGYRAVLLAAWELPRFFPMLMTAAGTITPAKCLVLGAGVAGLQAIATARRLGAVVEAFDVRPVVKEQVESLGAKFIEMELTENLQDEQGYAKEASPEFLRKQMELLSRHLAKCDFCITTAQVFGKKAPILITEAMVKNMRPGSVIVDLAAESGGNCELTQPGESREVYGVKIIAPTNITSGLAKDASKMFSRNLENLILHMYRGGPFPHDENDDIVKRMRITKDGYILSELLGG